nr:metal-iron-binding protein [Clostridium mobile]
MDVAKYICSICGMIINEKNSSFNKEAFEKKNTLEDIKHCPFCGVDKKYIGDEKEVELINKKIEGLSSDALKILDHATKLEVFNGDFYKKASLIAKDKKIKDMFEALANIEYMHARVHKTLGGFKELPKLRDMDYSKYNSDDILIKIANKREQHAVHYYTKYYSVLNSKTLEDIFNAFISVEKDHINLTINI